MPGNTIMINDQEEEKSKLNNFESQINRGFELMLRQHHRREKSSKPKTFFIRFGKMLSLFRREIHFGFEFYLDIKKK